MALITIGDITVDAVITESHTLESETTSYPVEDGPNITDHTRAMPRTVSMDCVVSDTPIGADLIALRERETGGFYDPSEFVFLQLLQIRKRRRPVKVTTSLCEYEQVVMTSCTATRDKDSGRILAFNCSFTEVEIVNTQRATIVATIKPAGMGFRAPKLYGTTPVKAADGSVTQAQIYDRGAGKVPRYTYADGSAAPQQVARDVTLTDKAKAKKVELVKTGGGRPVAGKPRVPGEPYTPPWSGQ